MRERLRRVVQESGLPGAGLRLTARALRWTGGILERAADVLVCDVPYRRLTSPRLKRLLAANSTLQGCHEGKRCFVLGTGPSLRDQDLSVLRGEIVVTVNQGFLFLEEIGLDATYVVVIDEMYAEERLREMFVDLGEYCLRKRASLVLTPTLLEAAKLLPRGLRPFCVAPIMRSRVFDDSGRLVPIDACYAQPGFESSVHCAIALALYMGASEIYLLGCDMDYFIYPHDIYRHAYAHSPYLSDDTPVTELFGEDQVDLMERGLAEYRAFLRLGELAGKRGQRIVNLTQGGCLEVYPRRTLGEVFAEGPLRGVRERAAGG